MVSTSRQPVPIAPLPRIRRRFAGQEGYNLVMLVVAITVLNILVALILPVWSHRIRREKEEEAIFRGLQYAEAIRVFQLRFGRFPTALKELIEVEPPSIRQLWEDPLTDHGEFGLLVDLPQARQGNGNQNPQELGGNPAADTAQNTPPNQPNVIAGIGVGSGNPKPPGNQQLNLVKLPRGGDDGEETLVQGAAIHGVYIDSSERSIRKFMEKTSYDQWLFAVEMLPVPAAGPELPLPNVRSDWIGKSFAEGLTPVSVAAATNVTRGQAGQTSRSGQNGQSAAGGSRRPQAGGDQNSSSKGLEDARRRLRDRLGNRDRGDSSNRGRGGSSRLRGD